MPRKLKRRWMQLLAPALLQGCAQTVPSAPIAVNDLCASWRHQVIRKVDNLTDATASEIEGNDKARTAWGCEWGKTNAKIASQ